MELIGAFLQENTRDFCFDEEILEPMADDARASFAGKVGAGISDILMDDIGHSWRANAREILGVKRTSKIPDFVYDPGPNAGYPKDSILVVEAKGSLSPKGARAKRIVNLSKSAYTDQVSPYLGRQVSADPRDRNVAPPKRKLLVAGGYAVAFGAVPGAKSTLGLVAAALPQFAPSLGRAPTMGFALSAAATQQPQHQAQPATPDQQQQQEEQLRQEEQRRQLHREKHDATLAGGGGHDGKLRTGDGEREERSAPNGRIAFANYEAVFELLNAWIAADRLRQSLSGQAVTDGTAQFQEFVTTENDDFLIGPHGFGPFAIYRPIAEAVLRAIYANPERPPETLSLPTVPPRYREDEEQFLAQGDGFAVADIWGPCRPIRWNFKRGRWA